MVSLHDLWIGEKVWVNSLQKEGFFEGVVGGQVKVRVGHNHHLIPPADLALTVPSREQLDLSWITSDRPSSPKPQSLKTAFPQLIDLHIEVLNPDLVNAPAARILDYQLTACRQFVLDAIDRRIHRVTIVHGIGLGVLKQEVEHLLAEFRDIKYILPVNQDGALEVWL